MIRTFRLGRARQDVALARDFAPIKGKLSLVKGGKKLVPTKLPPDDPDAILGIQPITNVVVTDEDYKFGQNDYGVIAQTSVTLTLADSPLALSPVIVVADGGNVTVEGGANVIQDGTTTVPQGSLAFFSFSPLSQTWSVLLGGSGGGGSAVLVLTPLGSNNVASNDSLVEGFLASGACTGVLPGGSGNPAVPTIGERHTFKNMTSDAVHGLTVIGGGDVEDPANPGVFSTDSITFTGQGASYTWEWDGTYWVLVGQ